MLAYSDFHYYWVIFEVINGLVISIFGAVDITILFRHTMDNAPIVGWALDLKDSKNSFSILISAAVLFVAVFVVYLYGSVLGDTLIKEIAELFGTFSYLMVSYVIIEWSKIFMRFI